MNNKRIPIKEQDDILNCEDKNLIISASAGSGKTTIMIAKIFNYILQKKCKVSQLLVLTYTKSAASEMKQKLINKLRENLADNPTYTEELEDVLSSDISTFDSFCQKLIKKYFYILNIDPSFNILEGGEKTFIQSKAINESIRELKQKDIESFEVLLNSFSPSRNEETIKKIILELYSYTTSLLDVDEFTNNSLNLYKNSLKIAENYLNSYYFNVLNQIKLNLQNLQTTANKYNFTSYVSYINNLLSIIDNIILEKEFGKKIDFLSDVDYKRLLKENTDEIDFNIKITHEKNKLKTVIDKMKESFVSSLEIDNSYSDCSIISSAMFSLLNIFISKYSLHKKNLNVYDFDDIEKLTLKLLENKQACEEIKSNYKYIFVDEFQDANAIQEKIIFSLQNNNLFFVGDTKQSIYAFRKSDPEIFLNIEKDFEKSNSSEAKTLNCNFRTNKNILDFANIVFSKIMTEKTSGINYKEKAMFDPKAPYEDVENEINVSINILNKPTKEKNNKPTEVYDLFKATSTSDNEDSGHNQAVFVCEQILSLLGNEIYDKDLGKTKKVELSDITILLAKRGSFLNTLTQQLAKTQIPFIVNTNTNIEEIYDVMVLYNLIKYSQNYRDDYSLYSVISSELFNFSDSEIAKIKLTFPDFINFYESFNEYQNLNDLLSTKIKKFFTTINEFTFNSKYKGLYYALEDIVHKTNYLLNISTGEDFINRRLAIEQYIDSFCNSKYNYDICGYISFMETSLSKEKSTTQTNSVNAVNITTMHSSKGLEYPIVILPNLNDDLFKSPSNTSDIKINKSFGLGIKAFNLKSHTVSNGIFYEACRIKNKLTEQSEKIRLLYVATTRAKNKLIMIGYNNKNYNSFSDDYEILSCNNYLGLIMGSLDESIIQKVNNEENFNSIINNNPKIVINCQTCETVSITYKNVVVPKKNDFEKIEEFSKYLNIDLSNQQQFIALKNSVSSFSFDDNSSLNFAPKSLSIYEHLSEKPNLIGTLVHKVLELINFDNINSVSDVKLFIECNFNIDEISLLKEISYEKIYKNIQIIKSFIPKDAKVLKEQKFVMFVPYSEATKSTNNEKILVQGIIDLLIIKDNKITILDYKLSSKSSVGLSEFYKKQLELYSLATSKCFKNYTIEKYIINLNNCEIITM